MKIRFYVLCFRNEGLIASQLEPEDFGRYMATGTRKLTRGSLMFFEIDPTKLTTDYFRLHDIETRCVPHSDGSPKRSKHISIYRVLENLNLDTIKRLYLVTVDGRVLPVDATRPTEDESATEFLYQELCPINPLIASKLNPSRFCQFMTDPTIPIFVPRLFFADLLLDREQGGRLAGFLPYEDPLHIEECLTELSNRPKKPTKTVSRSPSIHAFYRTVNKGFYLGDQTKMLYFPFPARSQLETEHARWWRSAQMS